MQYGFFLQDTTIENPYTNSIYKLKTSRIENKWPVAREGIPFIIAGIILTGIFIYFELLILWIILGIFSLFTIYFFRDPERNPSSDVNAIVSPADGTIIQIKKISDNQIVVANNKMHKTQANILAGCKVSLLYITKDKKAFQVKGSVDYQTSGAIFEEMKNGWLDKKYPGRAAVVINIEEVYSGAKKLA